GSRAAVPAARFLTSCSARGGAASAPARPRASQPAPVPASPSTHTIATAILILFHTIACNAPRVRAATWGQTVETAAPPAASGRAALTTEEPGAPEGIAGAASLNDTAASATAGARPRRINRLRSRCRADARRDNTVPRG